MSLASGWWFRQKGLRFRHGGIGTWSQEQGLTIYASSSYRPREMNQWIYSRTISHGLSTGVFRVQGFGFRVYKSLGICSALRAPMQDEAAPQELKTVLKDPTKHTRVL